mmetsp:Transcript_3038/g.8470  ORF Transcript_3038/g.8470 Transcript_3038/m.8470 type:complete len:264 (+) Transcript_3038:29-820(+)
MAHDMPGPCLVASNEKLFRKVVATIFAEGLLLNGSIVDCGAHRGGDSCYYADLDPTRIVHAIEPMKKNMVHVVRYTERRNIVPLLGALGSLRRRIDSHFVNRTYSMLTGLHNAPTLDGSTPSTWSPVDVYRLDDLFMNSWKSERFAFGHFDVEGSEEDLLRGASHIIQRDRPVFTVEVEADKTVEAAALFQVFRAFDYRALLVDEVAGSRPSVRNLICLPSERSHAKSLAALAWPVKSSAELSNLVRSGLARPLTSKVTYTAA